MRPQQFKFQNHAEKGKEKHLFLQQLSIEDQEHDTKEASPFSISSSLYAPPPSPWQPPNKLFLSSHNSSSSKLATTIYPHSQDQRSGGGVVCGGGAAHFHGGAIRHCPKEALMKEMSCIGVVVYLFDIL
ncbi:hypothetical protein BUALT_Bualt09G0097200 [Buddleja alternifolia]|uniref:Uncharacterized protein n=1 Tax=Buddleja alternifolia TaxID=168488 RepID=A0AAV6X9E7_9LAMI|nr:hypothetical protein BUALT_Bualt09G0097200 [Buddleja alternifolia]